MSGGLFSIFFTNLAEFTLITQHKFKKKEDIVTQRGFIHEVNYP